MMLLSLCSVTRCVARPSSPSGSLLTSIMLTLGVLLTWSFLRSGSGMELIRSGREGNARTSLVIRSVGYIMFTLVLVSSTFCGCSLWKFEVLLVLKISSYMMVWFMVLSRRLARLGVWLVMITNGSDYL